MGETSLVLRSLPPLPGNSRSCTTENIMVYHSFGFSEPCTAHKFCAGSFSPLCWNALLPPVSREEQGSGASILWPSRHLLVKHDSVWKTPGDTKSEQEICLTRNILFMLGFHLLPGPAQDRVLFTLLSPTSHSLAHGASAGSTYAKRAA